MIICYRIRFLTWCFHNMEYYNGGYCVTSGMVVLISHFPCRKQGYYLLCFLLIRISSSSIQLYINACTWHLKNHLNKRRKEKRNIPVSCSTSRVQPNGLYFTVSCADNLPSIHSLVLRSVYLNLVSIPDE